MFHPQTELEWNYYSEGSNTITDGFKVEELDELILKAPTIFDPDERNEIYSRIQEIIDEEALVLFWTREDTLAGFDKDLVLPDFTSLNDMFTSLPEWYWSAPQ